MPKKKEEIDIERIKKLCSDSSSPGVSLTVTDKERNFLDMLEKLVDKDYFKELSDNQSRWFIYIERKVNNKINKMREHRKFCQDSYYGSMGW